MTHSSPKTKGRVRCLAKDGSAEPPSSPTLYMIWPGGLPAAPRTMHSFLALEGPRLRVEPQYKGIVTLNGAVITR